MKSAQRIELAVENCVSLQVVLQWSFFSKLERYVEKKCFASNVLKEYNLLLKTVFDFIFC